MLLFYNRVAVGRGLRNTQNKDILKQMADLIFAKREEISNSFFHKSLPENNLLIAVCCMSMPFE